MAEDKEYSIGPCCQKIEDMISFADEVTDHWPAYYKRTIGEEIERQELILLKLVTKARLRYHNKTTLAELDTEKEIMKSLIRRANGKQFTDRKGQRRRLLPDHTYATWSEKMDEIGRIIGGWINSIKKEQ